jgi:hypothetical protein
MPKIGILEGLSNEQKEQLLTWLETYSKKEVLQKLAVPPPDGFNVRTHITSLHRFEQQYQVSNKTDTIALARGLLHSVDDLDLLKRGASSSLAQTALHLAASADPVRVSAGAKLLAALKRDDFREQELNFAREKLALERESRQKAAQIRERELKLDEARLELERQKAVGGLAIREAQAGNFIAGPEVKAAIGKILSQDGDNR